jgi:DNA-binding protein HU-beta
VNKAQLVDALTPQFDGNRRAAAHALEAVVDTITRSVVSGEKVIITGFGAFEKVARGARIARNPATGAQVKVKKTSVPKFKAGAELKAYVNGSKKLAKAAVAKKTTAKKAAKKATTKRTTAKRAPAKRATVKRATTKRAPAKRAPVKAAKRSSAKKASRKTTARKR